MPSSSPTVPAVSRTRTAPEGSRGLAGWVLCCAALSWSAPALACDCAALAPAQAYRRADAVFEGRVLAIEPAKAGAPKAGAAPHVAQLAVVRAWKGVQREQVELLLPHAGAKCDTDLAPQTSYLVYATEHDGGLELQPCSGTRPIAQADADLRALGMGVTPFEPGRGQPDAGAASAPPQPPARGGCASCAVGGGATSGGAGGGRLLLALAALCTLGASRATKRGRRLKRRRSRSRS